MLKYVVQDCIHQVWRIYLDQKTLHTFPNGFNKFVYMARTVTHLSHLWVSQRECVWLNPDLFQCLHCTCRNSSVAVCPVDGKEFHLQEVGFWKPRLKTRQDGSVWQPTIIKHCLVTKHADVEVSGQTIKTCLIKHISSSASKELYCQTH